MRQGIITKSKLTVILVLLTVFLTSCSSSGSVEMERDGSIKKYTVREIYENEKYGFYVKNEDNTYSPLMTDTPGRETGLGNKSCIWWCDYTSGGKDVIHEDLIPIVTDSTPLVAIFGADSEMPSNYKIEEYQDLGYSVGGKFQIGNDKQSLYFISSGVCPNSTFSGIASKVPDELTRVIEINDLEKLPLGNVDKVTGVMLGLQKDKYYKFTCFVGTSTRGYTVSADTRVFKQVNSITLDFPLTETKQQFFEVNLPSNLEDGYYYINDAGMFKVQKGYKNND